MGCKLCTVGAGRLRKKWISAACSLTLVSPEGEKLRKAAIFMQGAERHISMAASRLPFRTPAGPILARLFQGA